MQLRDEMSNIIFDMSNVYSTFYSFLTCKFGERESRMQEVGSKNFGAPGSLKTSSYIYAFYLILITLT